MNLLRWCRNEWERTSAVMLIGAGLVVFVLGWVGQQDKGLVTEQIPYVVSGAMFGLLLIILGATIWLSADLRDEWVKLDRLEEAVTRTAAALETSESTAATAATATPGGHRALSAEARPASVEMAR
ncbi:MAG TPA: hypothetical protein VE081_09575 [Sporichthyaceae bacterium]|nr:hypothetical protein [Sporichthyaceae bacterium]